MTIANFIAAHTRLLLSSSRVDCKSGAAFRALEEEYIMRAATVVTHGDGIIFVGIVVATVVEEYIYYRAWWRWWHRRKLTTRHSAQRDPVTSYWFRWFQDDGGEDEEGDNDDDEDEDEDEGDDGMFFSLARFIWQLLIHLTTIQNRVRFDKVLHWHWQGKGSFCPSVVSVLIRSDIFEVCNWVVYSVYCTHV